MSLPLYIHKKSLTSPGQFVIFDFPELEIKTPKPCKTEYVWVSSPGSCLFILSLEKNVVQDITQGENTLELEVLIHDDETVDSGFANSVKDSIQSVIERTCVDARETLINHEYMATICVIHHKRGQVTYRRTFLQRFSNREAQVIVKPALDQSDHINRLKHIVHNT